jgi:hypothetical protein
LPGTATTTAEPRCRGIAAGGERNLDHGRRDHQCEHAFRSHDRSARNHPWDGRNAWLIPILDSLDKRPDAVHYAPRCIVRRYIVK